MHAEDGDTLTARMEAFADLSAVPAARDDGDQADRRRAVNRHGIALR